MNDSKIDERLFQDFNPIPTEEWEARIIQDLKGGDYQKKLVTRTLDGISVRPYYRDEDLQKIDFDQAGISAVTVSKNHRAGNSWLIHQEIFADQLDQVASKANHMIERGVESVCVRFAEPPATSELVKLISELPLSKAVFSFAHTDQDQLIEAVQTLIKNKEINPDELSGSLGWDVFTKAVLSGKWSEVDAELKKLPSYLEYLKNAPSTRFIELSGIPFRSAGGTVTQELGAVLSALVCLLDSATELGIQPEALLPRMTIKFAVGSNYFFELAKFRAARELFGKIQEAYQIKPIRPVFLHAESSNYNKTIYDPFVNLLRTTTESMSAVLGGADALCVLPFNAIYQSSNEFSERLARNQQILLREEAYLGKVIDPAHGSYYLETLTHQICEESWRFFQSLEEQGGFVESFMNGFIQNEIVSIAEKRDQRLAARKDMLLGTNQYPNSSEMISDQIDEKIAFPVVVDPGQADAQPLIPYRVAESYERLRLSTEHANKRPKIFLLPVGNPVMRTARAMFAGNFFGCAGYEIINNIGFADLNSGLEKAKAAKADVIVLCSSDDEYAELGLAAADTNPGAELVIAGNPVDHLKVLQEAGIRHFIHVRTNVLEFLQGFNELLGINR